MTPAGLLVGLLVAAPTLYAAVIRGSVPVDVALQRLLIILVVAGVVWAGLEKLVRNFSDAAVRARAEKSDASEHLPQADRRRDPR